jgi:hypothetical protein
VALDRILVLPHVASSRFGTCLERPFSFYYSPDSLSNLGISTISQAGFKGWLSRQAQAPSTQYARFVVGGRHEVVVFEAGAKEDAAGVVEDVTCLSKGWWDVRAGAMTVFAPVGDWKRATALETFGKEVAAGFREREMSAPSDVLVVEYDLRYEMLTPSVAASFNPHSNHLSPSPFSYFDYRSHFVDLANQLTTRLSPYVAIHWRTETLDVRHLPSCASSLIETLVAIKRQHPSVSAVYLATDYPIESLRLSSTPIHHLPAKAHSGTFTKSLTPAHEAAMRGFLAEFDAVAAQLGLRLTSFEREQASLSLAPKLSSLVEKYRKDTGDSAAQLSQADGAARAAVDQLVARDAKVFVAGLPAMGMNGPKACAKHSGFTEQIVDARRTKAGEEGGEGAERAGVVYFEMLAL